MDCLAGVDRGGKLLACGAGAPGCADNHTQILLEGTRAASAQAGERPGL